MIGQRVSHYEVLSKLGQGGMGVVFLARDLSLDRKVALKFLTPNLSSDRINQRRILEEAKAAGAIDHPFVCKIYEVGETNGTAFIVMEFVEGETLQTRIRDAALPLKIAQQIASEIVEALVKAHSIGVIHRDLKPANIMLTREGHVKVMDFGLAERLRPERGEGTVSEWVPPRPGAGTAGYMSPEQIRGEALDQRSDLFSFGIILYEMIEGKHPFQKATAIETSAAILRDEVVPSSAGGLRRCSPMVDRILFKALAKDLAVRYQSAAEILADLRALHEEIAVRAAPSRSRPAGLSIAVLPFVNLSADKENEYFSDGITEDIITSLSRIPGLHVISRTSVMRYKGASKSPQEIASELGVDVILEGSVRRAGNRVRIRSGLVEVDTHRQLWGEAYDRDMVDIFEIQSEVAERIATTLNARLSAEHRELLQAASSQNLDAYQLYLQGRHFLNRMTPEGINKAIECFEGALAHSPDYARTYAAISTAYVNAGHLSYKAPQEAFPKASEAARRALELDPRLAEAHCSMAMVLFHYQWQWAEAERFFKRAIELNQSYAEAHTAYSLFLTAQGRNAQAIEQARRGLDLDPLSLLARTTLGWVMHFAGHYEEAIQNFETVLEMDPNYLIAHSLLAVVYLEQGRYAEAIAILKQWHWSRAHLAQALATAGDENSARQVLKEITDPSQVKAFSAFDIGLIHFLLGENDDGFRWFQQAYEARDNKLIYVKEVFKRARRVHVDPTNPQWLTLLDHLNLRQV
jgi:eukaryotic-like serine/threonine-protein kinase